MKFKLNKKYTNIGIHIIILSLILVAMVFSFINLSYIYDFIKVFIGRFWKLISPIVLGLIFAYLLDPLVEKIDLKLKKKKKNRFIATAITYLILVTFLILIGFMISTSLSGNSQKGIIDNTIKSIQEFIFNIDNLSENVKVYFEDIFKGPGEDIADGLIEKIGSIVQIVGNSLIGSLRIIGGYIVKILMGLLIAFYFLMDKDLMLKEWNRFLDVVVKEKRKNKMKEIWAQVDWVVSGYIRGQLIDVLIMGILISIVLMVLKIDYAIVIGILSGLANLIPMVGSIVATILAALVALASGDPMKAVYALIVLTILQQIDGNIITPKVVGKNVNLHPILVVLAILLFGSLWGILGMVLAVPSTALIKHFYLEWVDRKLKEKGE